MVKDKGEKGEKGEKPAHGKGKGNRPNKGSAGTVNHRRCRALGKMQKQSPTQMSDNDKAAWTECKAKFQARIEKFKACKAEEDEAKRDGMGCPKGKRPKGKGKRRKKGGRRG